MNQALITLFRNDDYVELLRQNLPQAFELADGEMRRMQQRKDGTIYSQVNPAVGLLRENILVAFLAHTLGDMHVVLPDTNSAMKDVEVFGKPLEVKTATENGSVKAKWTADTVSAKNDINRFEFTSDLLLVRIWWGKERDSVFYVPVEVLQELTETQLARNYLTSASGTNNRGIEISKSFLARAEQHDKTIRIPIRWCRSNMRVDPLARWRPIWSDSNYRDLLRR